MSRKTKSKFVTAEARHNHRKGTAHCRQCKLEKTLPREGAVPWDKWCQQLVVALGFTASWTTETSEGTLVRACIDQKDATEHWSRNFTPEGYIKLLGRKPAPVRKPKWNGMAPCGKHGADFEGQECDICNKLNLPDATIETVLTTREVLSSIERWAESCRTGKINSSRRGENTVRDLVYEIQSEVETWIEALEEDGR